MGRKEGEREGEDFRERIYAQYMAARMAPPPRSIADLEPRRHFLAALIGRHFPRDKQAQILELGCGHGAVIHFARRSGYPDIHGVDRSPDQVALARELGIEGVQEGDALATVLGAPASSLDAVVAVDLIEHYTKRESLGLLEAVWRALKPGGRLILHTPNAESPFGSRMVFWDITHEQAFTRSSIVQLLSAAGFGSVTCFEDVPAVHGPVSLGRFILWKIIRTGLYFYMAVETGDWKSPHIFSQNFTVVAYK